jgi:hypothetical protein
MQDSTIYLHEEDKTARWDESRMRDGRKEQWTERARENGEKKDVSKKAQNT